MVIIINREMAVDTTSELEPPTPPSDGLERDSSPTFDAVLLRHTHAHIRPTRFHFCYQIPTSTAKCHPLLDRSAPPRPRLFFYFSFSIIIIITKELLEKAWRQFDLAGR